jgi:membrane fusion protein, multidrug efflux system
MNTEPTKSIRLTRLAIKGAILGLAVVGLIAISKLPKRQQALPETEAPPVNVTVMTVIADPNRPDSFDLPAIVEPNQVVTLSAEISGRIERIHPQEGDRICIGDLLIQLNTEMIAPQLKIAEETLNRDKIEYERMANLVKIKATASQDLDNAATSLVISQAGVMEMRARFARTRIATPTTGVLNDLLVEHGEYVAPGDPVAQIVDVDTVKVVVEIPERDIGFFDIGQPTEVMAVIKGEEHRFSGPITFISALADMRTRSTRVEIRLANPEGLLRSGQIVSAHLTRRTLKDAIFIPLLAVIPMEEGKAVFVANASEAQRQKVTLGMIKGDQVHITSGLAAGDQLIIAGHRFVSPGQPIRIVTEEP